MYFFFVCRPYRMVHAMLKGMKEKNSNAMYNMMSRMHESKSNSAPQIHVVPVQQQDSMMEKM